MKSTQQDSGSITAVAGCRMVGGGFGGSCLALVQEAEADGVRDRLGQAFYRRFGHHPSSFLTTAAAGARLIHA